MTKVRVRFMSSVAVLAAGALVVTLLEGSASAVPGSTPAPIAEQKQVGSRPDRVSAMSTAQLQGVKVEDESARTPTSATYANADGSWTTESYAGVVRAAADEDEWVPVDSTVEKTGDGYHPKAIPFDVSFSDGGDRTVGTVETPSNATVKVEWPSALPAPIAEGATLTYPKAAEGADLVVTSRPDGFNYSMVLDHAPGADAEPVEYRIPLAFEDAQVNTRSDGTIVLTDGENRVATMTAPVMWDGAEANKDGEGERLPVTADVEGSGNVRTLVLRPDMDFLRSPGTVYPVTVDPSLIVNTAGDTWVQSSGDTTSQYNSGELRIGSNDSGATIARSYVYFDFSSVSTIPNAVITSAEVRLSNFESGSCAGSALRMSRITGGWTIPSVTWATQPAVTSAGATTAGAAYGASGCAGEGTITFDANQIFTDWLGGAWNVGVQIKADNETAASGFRKVRSLENGDLTKVPQFVINYNTKPDVPAGTQVTPGSGSGSTIYTTSDLPTFNAAVTDPDGSNVTAQFQLLQGSTVVHDWTSGSVPSGSQVSRTLPLSVADGTYTAQWRVSDGSLTSNWSTGQTVVVDTVKPTAPTVNCNNGSGYVNNSWSTTGPSSAPCTVTVSGDTVAITATKNGQDAEFPDLASGSTSKTFAIASDDYVNLAVVARDAAGNASNTTTYKFGVGGGLLDAPASGARSTGSFPINATSFATSTGAYAQWRLTGTSTYTTATKVTKAGVAWTGSVTDSGVLGNTGDLDWDAASEPGVTSPSNLDVRVCFNYSSTPTLRCTQPRQVSLIQHAFGGSFPTSDVGPASVSLLTGEFQVDSGDVSVPGYGDELSISRTAQSFGTPASPAQGVFGPGWIANLQGPSVGFAAAQVVDKTSTNGTIMLLDTDGDTSTYKFGGTAAAQAVGVYAGQGLAATYNERLEIKTGSPKTLVLTEDDGTVTTWSYAGSNVWNIKSVVDPSVVPESTFDYSGGSYVTGIFSRAPGVTTANCSATTQVKGCRALFLTYTGSGASTRLSQVDLRTWDPKPSTNGAPTGAAGWVTIPVAKYSYDGSGLLTSAWDPRLDYNSGASHVATTYTYQTAAGRTMLASLTPPSEKTWNFNLDGSGRLDTVTRDQDAAIGGTATWKVKYGVALSGSGLPTMTPTQVATWGQTQAPTQAAGVFGPDAPNFTDHTYADLSYFTADGRTTNTVGYGAGAWQIDTTQYDSFGQVSWTLDAVNRALGFSYDWSASEISRDLTTRYTHSASGDRVEQVVGPHATVISNNGTTVYGRERTRYDYDDEVTAASGLIPGRPTPDPNKPRANLVVQETTDLVEVVTGNVFDPKVTRYQYNPVVAGDGDGWTLQIPTRTLTSLGAGWSKTVARFDTQGRTIESRTPVGAATADTANDSRSTKTIYFTADASSPIAACQNKPEWADEVCQTAPGAGDAPTTTVSGFDYLANQTRSIASSGGTDQVSVSTYDGAGRKTRDSLSTVNAPTGQIAVPDTTYVYDNATGALLTTGNGTATSTNTYDSWGRALTQTDGAGNTGTTTYDAAGRTKTVDDGKGVYTYTYDGTDAAGKTERRGLVTKVDVGLPSGPDEFSAAYDNGGNQTKLVYPNGVTADSVFDGAGNQITLTYSNAGTAFMGFMAYSDVEGRIRTQLTPLSYDNFTYDDRGRLTQVQDKVYDQCTTRTYTFSLDSNRTQMKSYAPASNGACSTSTTATTVTGTFDGDDKKTGGYVYDTLGRTTTLPAADAVMPSGGDVSVTYHANDMVATLSQGSGGTAAGKTYGLDVLGRLSTMSSTTGGVELRKTQSQYSDSSDSPAWATEDTRPNGSSSWTSTWSRFVESPSGDLGLIQKSDGSNRLQLTNLHGDVVATLPNSTYGGLQNYSESTEYGSARTSTAALGQTYTWLGAKRRSGDAIGGLVLMGVRLYNPVVGRFLSRDAIPGGNDNAYTYPADPINLFDLSGLSQASGPGGGGFGPKPRWASELEYTAYKKKVCGMAMTEQEKKAYKSYVRKRTTQEKYDKQRNVQKRLDKERKKGGGKGKGKGKGKGSGGGGGTRHFLPGGNRFGGELGRPGGRMVDGRIP